MTVVNDTLKAMRREVQAAADAGFPFRLESTDRAQAIEEWKFYSGAAIPDGSRVNLPMADGREQEVQMEHRHYATRYDESRDKWSYRFTIECRDCEPCEPPPPPCDDPADWETPEGNWFNYTTGPDFKALPTFCPKHSADQPVEQVNRTKASPILDAVREAIARLPNETDEVIVADVAAGMAKPYGRDTRKQHVKQALARIRRER